MSRRIDFVTGAIAVALHVALAVTILDGPPPARARSRPIEVEFQRPPKAAAPPPRAQPEAAAGPRAPSRAARPVRRKVAIAAPAPVSPAPDLSSRAPAPVFGIAMESPMAAASPIAAPVGGSTIADPGRRGGSRPAEPGSAGGGGFASELAIEIMPRIDTEACGRSITYPKEAEENGIEGKVRLRVALDERGRVSSVRVLSGLGHGLDQAAAEALKHRCKFSPAIARGGRPVPFVVESYTFTFELPR